MFASQHSRTFLSCSLGHRSDCCLVCLARGVVVAEDLKAVESALKKVEWLDSAAKV